MIGYIRLTAKASENQKGGGWGLGNGETLSTCTEYLDAGVGDLDILKNISSLFRSLEACKGKGPV